MFLTIIKNFSMLVLCTIIFYTRTTNVIIRLQHLDNNYEEIKFFVYFKERILNLMKTTKWNYYEIMEL